MTRWLLEPTKPIYININIIYSSSRCRVELKFNTKNRAQVNWKARLCSFTPNELLMSEGLFSSTVAENSFLKCFQVSSDYEIMSPNTSEIYLTLIKRKIKSISIYTLSAFSFSAFSFSVFCFCFSNLSLSHFFIKMPQINQKKI